MAFRRRRIRPAIIEQHTKYRFAALKCRGRSCGERGCGEWAGAVYVERKQCASEKYIREYILFSCQFGVSSVGPSAHVRHL